MVAAGEIGPVHLVHGAYLQDWLLEDTDYSWRLDPAQGESSAMADIGSHWCDLAQHVCGQRITAVLASLTTVVASRIKPGQATPAFTAAGRRRHARGDCQRGPGRGAAALLGRRRRRRHRRPGVRRPQERLLARGLRPPGLAALGAGAPERAVDRRQAPRQHAAGQGSVAGRTPRRSPTCGCPAGHQEGWADAFFNVMRDIYGAIAAPDATRPRPPAMATFDDGYASARARRGGAAQPSRRRGLDRRRRRMNRRAGVISSRARRWPSARPAPARGLASPSSGRSWS